MKVLYYIHSLYVGGAETIVANSLLTLKEKGVDVVLVQNSRRNTFLDEKIDNAGIPSYTLLPNFNSGILGGICRAVYYLLGGVRRGWKKIIDATEPDIVHCHTDANLLKYLNFPADKMVCTIHSDVERNKNVLGKGNFNMLKKLSKNGMRFFSLSEKATNDINRIYAPAHIAYIPNGVDITSIRSSCYNRNEFLSSIGVPTNAFVIGHVGRFHPVKNHKKLIEVFYEVSKKRSDAYLLLVGTGTSEEIANVKAMVDGFSLTDRVIFLGLRDDASAIMSVMDVFVLPSLSESFSLVLVEAQVQGVRCIASDAVPQSVVCNADCFRLSLDEPSDAWADLVVSNSTHSDVNSLENFDILTVADRMCEEYCRCLNA